MRKWATKHLGWIFVAAVFISIYTITFACWWLRSPSRIIKSDDGKCFYVVDFQFNKVSYYSGVIWKPAFLFMEHIFGYRDCGYIAMYDQSVQKYGKQVENLTSEIEKE